MAKKKYAYLIIALLIVASFAAFGRIAENDFVNFDDDIYVTKNIHTQSGINFNNIQWAFASVVLGNWHPLTMISHEIDWSLFGRDAAGHHVVSLLLHIGTVIWLFLFLNKTTNSVWPSFFASAFFAFHPLRVESVAWIAERKDVLSMFWGMASIYFYAVYVEKNKISFYCLCLILFILSLMSKPMLVTLPFILLLLDYWPLKRWEKSLHKQNEGFNSLKIMIWEKIPFICITGASSIVTLWTQNKDGATAFGMWLPFAMRGTNAFISFQDYLVKIFWPKNLAVFYPYALSLSVYKAIFSGMIILSISIAVVYYMKRTPCLFTSWFWFLGTLIPVIGLVQVGRQAMADRYTYLPSIGVGILLAWGVPYLFKQEYVRKKILIPIGSIVIVVLIFLTWHQCGNWKNSLTLWNHTLKTTKKNYLAHQYIGLALYDKGMIHEAIDNYHVAISIEPNFLEAYHSRGNAYAKLNQYYQALTDYDFAISMKKDYADAYVNRGFIYSKLGKYQQMLKDFDEAVRLQPYNAKIYHKRGYQYFLLGQYQRAIDDYTKAISLNPNYADAYNERGIAYGALGQHQLAINDFDKTLRLNPRHAEAHNNRGFTYAKLGQLQQAMNAYNKAIRLNPDYTTAFVNRGIVSIMKGNKETGCRDMKKACELGSCESLENSKIREFCR